MRTVVLVDDDRTNSTLVKMLLEMDGFRVLVFPDVEQTRSARLNGVDAFVIDCNLAQGNDGIALLRAIRLGQTSVATDIPVVMTSGDDRRSAAANQAGATRFLLKPYSPSKLSQELSALLD